MDKILDMMAKWEPFGQGFFLFLIFIIACGFLSECWKYFVALFRGWPPAACECCDEDDDPDKTQPYKKR